jgi:REP element-mobilizing transposase RayT
MLKALQFTAQSAFRLSLAFWLAATALCFVELQRRIYGFVCFVLLAQFVSPTPLTLQLSETRSRVVAQQRTLGYKPHNILKKPCRSFPSKLEQSMSQSLAQIYLHIIFSTKDRLPFLSDQLHRGRTFAYLGGICNTLHYSPLTIGGVSDHFHLLCRMDKTLALAEFLRELKRDSSAWFNEQGFLKVHFNWQSGYGAFSVSPSHVEVLKHYIQNQEEHHRTETFQDEFRRICKSTAHRWMSGMRGIRL